VVTCVVGALRVPNGRGGRVTKIDGDGRDVSIGGVLRYARGALSPPRAGQVLFAQPGGCVDRAAPT
jgi:hypothetical protein